MVFLPSAAFGNGRVLVTTGRCGEVMSLFYPYIDWARNVRECLVGVHFPVEQRFAWSWDGTWDVRQAFEDSDETGNVTDVLRTVLRDQATGVTLTLTDVCPPDESAWVREFAVTGATPVRVGQYFHLALGDVPGQNSVHFLHEHGCFVQRYRDIVFCIAVNRPIEHQCGKLGQDGSSRTKWDLTMGRASGQEMDLGDVDFSLAFQTEGAPEGRTERSVMVVAAGATQEEAMERAQRLLEAPFPKWRRDSHEASDSWLGVAPSGDASEYEATYQRSLLVLRDLVDAQTGGLLAAPEFDPDYLLSGGYGYCWPRDAAEAALALARAGYVSDAERVMRWCMERQLPSGHWYQRYWVSGQPAPAWCVYPDFYQLDQTAATVDGLCRIGLMLPSELAEDYLATARPTVERGWRAIERAVGDDGLHETAADLWERFRGVFTYTSAAICRAALSVQATYQIPCRELAERVKSAALDRFFMPEENRFARGLGWDGQLDTEHDSSILGVIEPFGMLDLTDDTEFSMALDTLESVEKHLSIEIRGRRCILRHEHDPYMGGAAGCVNTLWTARVHLTVAKELKRRGRSLHAEEHIWQAEEHLRTAMACANPSGQLPELIVSQDGYTYWAAPHAWASGLFVVCVLELMKLNAGLV